MVRKVVLSLQLTKINVWIKPKIKSSHSSSAIENIIINTLKYEHDSNPEFNSIILSNDVTMFKYHYCKK